MTEFRNYTAEVTFTEVDPALLRLLTGAPMIHTTGAPMNDENTEAPRPENAIATAGGWCAPLATFYETPEVNGTYDTSLLTGVAGHPDNPQNRVPQSLRELWDERGGTPEPEDGPSRGDASDISVRRGGIQYRDLHTDTNTNETTVAQPQTAEHITWSSLDDFAQRRAMVTLTWLSGAQTILTDDVTTQPDWSQFSAIQRRLMVARLEHLTDQITATL